MSQKKTISINKNIPQALIVGLLLGFLTVFVVEHFGKISYVADTYAIESEKELERKRYSDELDSNSPLAKAYAEYDASKKFSSTSYDITGDTPVSTIFLVTPFGSKLRIVGRGYTVSDVGSSYGSFNDYSNKLKHYLRATFEDAKYLLYFGAGYGIFIVVFLNFRVELT